MRIVAGALLAAALLGACSDDDGDDDATTTTASSAPAESTTSTTAGPEESTTSTTAAPEADPAEVAARFLATFFPGTTATVGEFQQGDAQSGEVQVFRPAEGGGTANVASILLLRIVDGEWQVTGAANPNVTIEAPENGAEVDAGPLAVTGVGRGFEATLVASVFDLEGNGIVEAVGSGGAQAEPLPYEITLDLTGVEPGTELVLVVAGGTGLEGDPGEFSAVRITT